jgi:hypothetical protein
MALQPGLTPRWRNQQSNQRRNPMPAMKITTRSEGVIDPDTVERVKLVYGTHLRVYFENYLVEYHDPDGSLYEALKHLE